MSRPPRVHILACIAGLHLGIDEQLISSFASTIIPLSSCEVRHARPLVPVGLCLLYLSSDCSPPTLEVLTT